MNGPKVKFHYILISKVYITSTISAQIIIYKNDKRDYFIGTISGKMPVFGTMYYTNNSSYFGHFENGKRNGDGTLLQIDGTSFVGNFIDDEVITNKTFSSSFWNGNHAILLQNKSKRGKGKVEKWGEKICSPFNLAKSLSVFLPVLKVKINRYSRLALDLRNMVACNRRRDYQSQRNRDHAVSKILLTTRLFVTVILYFK